MTDDKIQIAQAAPRRERPKQERPAGDGDNERRPPAKGQQPATKGKREPVRPPWISMGVQMGGLSVQDADQNSIELASAGTKPKGPNEIT